MKTENKEDCVGLRWIALDCVTWQMSQFFIVGGLSTAEGYKQSVLWICVVCIGVWLYRCPETFHLVLRCYKLRAKILILRLERFVLVLKGRMLRRKVLKLGLVPCC